MSLPFVEGRLELLQGLTPDVLAKDVAPFLALCAPNDVSQLLTELDRSAQEMTPLTAELCINGPDGRTVLEVRAIPEQLEAGVMEWDGFLQDVTVQRKIPATSMNAGEARAPIDNDLLNAVLDSSPDVIVFALDRNYRYLAFNRQHLQTMRAIWGKEIRTGMNMLEAIGTEEDRAKSRRSFDRALSGESFVEEEAYGDEALARRHWQIFWSPIRSETGEVNGLTCFVLDISGHRRMAEELRRREQYLRTLLDNFPFLVWLKDKQSHLLAANEEFARAVGVASALELEGKTDFEIFPHDLAAQYVVDDKEVMDSGKPKHLEEPFVDALGNHLWIETWKSPLIVDGQTLGTVGFFRDITERKEIELRLEETHWLLHSVLQGIPDPVWMKDANGVFLVCNPGVGRLFNTPVEDIIGKTDHDFFDPELAEFYLQKDRTAMEAGQVRINEEWWTFGDNGERVLMETRKVPVKSADGKFLGVLGVARDITKRNETEVRFADTYQRLRSVLVTIPDLVWMKDTNGAYLACNHAFERFFGAAEAEIIGKTDYDFVDKYQADFFLQKDREAIAAGCICINEEWVTYADSGERGLLETRKVPVYGPDGSITGILGVARDITERKRIEEALAKREREFRTLVENTPDTVARFGPDLRRKFVNPALAAFLGKSTEELLGRKTSEFPGGPSGDLAEAKLIEVFATGQAMEFEYIWHSKHGEETCSLVRMTPEFNNSGEVESVLSVGRDITEMNAFRYKIHQMAFYDTLTGLPNRALFNDRLSQMIADAAWHSQSAGLMMIDLDRFKVVNDTMGHMVGDELLREAARRLTDCVRSYDTVARLGGDEFAVILPDIRTGADLGRIASKMLAKFDESFLLDGKDVFVTCSIGIALYPDDSVDEQDLLKFADSAMYFAKRSGRNNFRFYAKDLTTTAQSRLTLESDLRHAIARGELELYYQPKVSLQNGWVTGSEALLRWHHPQQGMVPPGEFIQVAEDTGLIVDIGKWVLREACKMAAAWNAAEERKHKVAINLSPRQFQTPDLVAVISHTLADTACRPEWIELEITESLLLDEDGQVLDILRALRDMDISIAIDDFGTGYSALSYLARFPIDTLKIDRSFINTVTTDHYRAELVRAILSIARCLGQEVVAEGVETVEQAAFLAAHGCQTAQGFLFSKAVPEAEFALLPRRFSSPQK
ncbi:MAG TPA: PAS domain-containing protein [Rhodocyclaceae bacterium]|nr:PAS domain-containing protein [Rhodocyclaceae bacterium]